MSSPSVTSPLAQARKAWYKEPYVWMIVGGPLAVVVASMFTVYLAVSHPDKVLERPRSAVEGGSGPVTAEERLAAERSALPATEARNHAASPTLPKDR